MKLLTLLLVAGLLCAGCADQAVQQQDAEKHWSEMIRDSIDYYYTFENGELVDNCDKMRDFAVWCQKAHPDVWREFHATVSEVTE